jgi:hypothetical protein
MTERRHVAMKCVESVLCGRETLTNGRLLAQLYSALSYLAPRTHLTPLFVLLNSSVEVREFIGSLSLGERWQALNVEEMLDHVPVAMLLAVRET